MKQDFNKKNSNYFPSQFIYLGYILICAGIYLIINLNIIGILSIIFGSIFSFSFIGIRFNFKEIIYQEYFNIFGFYFGKWREIPKTQYVTIYIEKYSQGMNVSSINKKNIYTNFKIDLIISEKEKINIGTYKNKDKAFNTGIFLAKKIKTKLLDYTLSTPEWIDIKS